MNSGRVLLVGGDSNAAGLTTPLSSVEWYNPNTGLFSGAGDMILARGNLVAAHLLDDTVLLAGGYGPSQATYQTAELFDPASAPAPDRTWLQLSAGGGPSGGAKPGIAYDAQHGGVVTFVNGNTWTWDGSAWTQQFSTTSPSSRSLTAMAYDGVRHEVVLFGGYNGISNLSDTWVWDGANWQQRFPAHVPGGRNGHALVFDSFRSEVVLFGGLDATFTTRLNDTWVWDGVDWTMRIPAASPGGVSQHGLAYDEVRHEVVLFGGAFSNPGETWVWNGTTWTNRTPSGSPGSRYSNAMTYDADRGVVVLFGGIASGFPSGETWEWNGATWTQKTSSSPGAVIAPALAYDGARHEVVMVGPGTWAYR